MLNTKTTFHPLLNHNRNPMKFSLPSFPLGSRLHSQWLSTHIFIHMYISERARKIPTSLYRLHPFLYITPAFFIHSSPSVELGNIRIPWKPYTIQRCGNVRVENLSRKNFHKHSHCDILAAIAMAQVVWIFDIVTFWCNCDRSHGVRNGG